MRVEEKEFHVCKTEDCSQFAANASIALKQSTPKLHLTINEKVIFESHKNTNPNLTLKTMHAWNRMWSSQAYAFSLHVLDAIRIKELLGLFVTFSTEQFHYTCLSVIIATKKLNENHHG